MSVESGMRPGLYAGHRFLGWLSGVNASAAERPRPVDVEGFRAAQRLAYDCVVAVGKEMQEGDSELEVTERLQAWLDAHGAPNFLHRPFAWFGEHSRFSGYDSFHDFHPGDRRLKATDIAILDVSPIVNGYIGDVGYTLSLSASPALRKAQRLLRELREEIPGLFMSSRSTAQIWQAVDRRIADAGYTNCHALYPLSVLGHRVYHVTESKDSGLRLPLRRFGVNWFSATAQRAFLSHGLFKEVLNPDHRGSKLGLWAIEPHVGGAGFGAKFEEILVVEDGRAYWLDDEVPHLRNIA
ncbi:aminopeptidase P family protein [Solimonas sp. K1W22B-7]|uniref:M24 family metallopeptidase n=1 Tax=Oleomonas cavernae TaxID=2320859 RepID=A0A418VTE5_9PROT|nr:MULTISPECIES: M24 family metallopeptidase [Pseudomonadota]AXQ28517.1 aminopeptidase P family protein [Solimonas sp. K1W22B-7]RJF80106.1 M24 family metallopeptidase [Oleomonas cavernae]